VLSLRCSASRYRATRVSISNLSCDASALSGAARSSIGWSPRTSSSSLRAATTRSGTLAQVLTNREWRFFAAALVAANMDHRNGLPDGGFYFSPARFAELLGVVADRDAVRKLDASLDALMSVNLAATVRVANKQATFTAEGLIIDGHGSVDVHPGRRAPGRPKRRAPGRPKARLFLVHPHFLRRAAQGRRVMVPAHARDAEAAGGRRPSDLG